MPVVPHFRISALGTLCGSSGERFSYGLNMTQGTPSEGGPPPLFGLAPNDAVFTDIANDVKTFHGSTGANISNRAVLREVKIAQIGSDGKYVTDPVIIDVADTPGIYSLSINDAILPQSAMAVSLNSARRGPTGKGRFYVPMPAVAIDGNTGLVNLSQAEGLRTAATTLIQNLNNQPGLDVLSMRVVIVSSKGYKSDVTSVRVGRVADTIRSRRAQLLENYTTPGATITT